MKKTLLPFLFCTCLFTTLMSQTYKPFEWEILRATWLIPVSNDQDGARGFTSEVRYNINDKFAIGTNYNLQFFGDLFDELLRGLNVTTSYGISADYHLYNKRSSRLYAGMGVGLYDNRGTTESGREVGDQAFGIMPRVAYKMGYVKLTADYHHTFDASFPNYFSLGVGFSIGGEVR